LLQINLKTFRHYKGSTLYAATKDLFHVKNVLGHVNIQNTIVYIHLLAEEPDDSFIVKVANDLTEFTRLIELGFEFVTDYDGLKVLRKRK